MERVKWQGRQECEHAPSGRGGVSGAGGDLPLTIGGVRGCTTTPPPSPSDSPLGGRGAPARSPDHLLPWTSCACAIMVVVAGVRCQAGWFEAGRSRSCSIWLCMGRALVDSVTHRQQHRDAAKKSTLASPHSTATHLEDDGIFKFTEGCLFHCGAEVVVPPAGRGRGGSILCWRRVSQRSWRCSGKPPGASGPRTRLPLRILIHRVIIRMKQARSPT